MIEDLIRLRKLIQEDKDRWLWELEQAENSRMHGDEQHFLRAKAGFRNMQEAATLVDTMIGNVTGWPDLFPEQVEPWRGE